MAETDVKCYYLLLPGILASIFCLGLYAETANAAWFIDMIAPGFLVFIYLFFI